MNDQAACDPERIERFLEQKLSDAEQALFESHLSSCASCRKRLETSAATNDIWTGVREFLRDRKVPSDEAPSIDVDSTSEDTFSSQSLVLKLLAPTDDDRMIGRWGTYEVVGVVGTGGMGVVLKAFDAALNRYVAIKILAPHLGNSGAARRRFSREAQAAAAVVHDNVIEIYGVAEAAGLPYLVMPYVRGPSLQRRLDDEGPLAVTEILRVGMQAAAGLAAAHAQGLVHRDVKPSNILLADGIERVKLTDFGLARAADDASLTKTGVIAGTPQYMSPEQARGETIDQRSDLFSLGSVLYAMCTGRPPFRAETSYGVLRRITDDEPRAIREINSEIPDWLCAIIGKLLAKRPEDRFQTASEVASLLEECLAHVQQPNIVPLPATIPPLPLGEGPGVRESAQSKTLRHFSSWSRKNRISLVIALLFLGIALTFGVILKITKDNKTTTIEVPDGSTAHVDTQGAVSVELPSKSASSPKFGPETHHVQAALELLLADGKAQFGQPIGVSFQIHNFTSKPAYTVMLFSQIRRDDDELIVEDPQGRKMEVHHIDHPGKKRIMCLALGGGDTNKIQSASLAFVPEQGDAENFAIGQELSYYVKVKPGRYSVRFRLHFPDKDYDHSPSWHGDLETAPVIVEVTADIRDVASVSSPRRSPYEARLPSGITLELLGTAEFQAKDKPWWRPDGSPLPERPYDSLGMIEYSVRDQILREVAVRLGNLPAEPVDTTWELTTSLLPASSYSLSRGNPTLHGAVAKDIRAISVNVPPWVKTISLRVGVAAGAWQTLGESAPLSLNVPPYNAHAEFIPFEKQIPLDKQATILATPVESPADNKVVLQVVGKKLVDATRFIVVDTKGHEYIADEIVQIRNAKTNEFNATFFNLQLAQIKQIRVQTRPYEWVELRNISLNAGQHSDVQVIAPADSRGKEEAGVAASVEKVPGIAIIPNGMRIVTVNNYKVEGGPIDSGDRVDVKGLLPVAPDHGGIGGKEIMVLHDLRVFAVNDGVTNERKIGKTVSLLVTSLQAQWISTASVADKITLIVHSASATSDASPPPSIDGKKSAKTETSNEPVLFKDDFNGRLSDKWQVVGLKESDYRVRNGGLEMRVQRAAPERDTPMLKVILPFTSQDIVAASVKVTLLDNFTQDGECAGLCLLDEAGEEFAAKTQQVDRKQVFAPPAYQFIGKPGEEGDPKRYDVKYTLAPANGSLLRITVNQGYAFFQAGAYGSDNYKMFFQSALRDKSIKRGFGLLAAGAPDGAEHWVRFENFRVTGATKAAGAKSDTPVATSPLRHVGTFSPGFRVGAIACSPDGKLIAVGNTGRSFIGDKVADNWQPSMKIIDAATGKLVASLKLSNKEEDALFATSFVVTALAFAPDGSLLAVGTDAGQIKLFRPLSGELVRALDDEKGKLSDKTTAERTKSIRLALGSVTSLAFSPDGNMLATCGEPFEALSALVDENGMARSGIQIFDSGRLKLWDVKTGALKRDLAGHSDLNALAFSPDGDRLATAGSWWRDGGGFGDGVMLWDLRKGEKIRVFEKPANGGTHQVVYSPDGKLLAFTSINYDKDKEQDAASSVVTLAHTASGIAEWQRTYHGWATPLFSPDGKRLLVGGDVQPIQVLAVETGTTQTEIRPADAAQGARWSTFAIAPQAGKLVIGSVDAKGKGNIETWDFQEAKVAPLGLGKPNLAPVTNSNPAVEKEPILSEIRKQRARRTDLMRHGQADYTRTDTYWEQDGKIQDKPSSSTTEGKVYFDEDNLCLDTKWEGERLQIYEIKGGRTEERVHKTIKEHRIWTKKWVAEWDDDSDVVDLWDPPGDWRPESYDPRDIAKMFVADSSRLKVTRTNCAGQACYGLEEVIPGASVRNEQFVSPQSDFALLRCETYFDNATRGNRAKLREDYPFQVRSFEYERHAASGVMLPVKCEEHNIESVPLADSRKPRQQRTALTKFSNYSFDKPQAGIFSLYRLSMFGAHRLCDNRKGHPENNWFNLPPLVNVADPSSKPDVHGLPPDLAEEWLKIAAAHAAAVTGEKVRRANQRNETATGGI